MDFLSREKPFKSYGLFLTIFNWQDFFIIMKQHTIYVFNKIVCIEDNLNFLNTLIC